MVSRVDKQLIEQKNYVGKLARDYIDKVLPFNARLYISPFSKRENVQVGFSDEKLFDQKCFIFSEIYRKFGIRLDIGGKKRHFFMQNSLRNYITFYFLIQNLNSIDIKKEDDKSLLLDDQNLPHNFKVLNSDIENRMADARLNEETARVFKRIVETSSLSRAFQNFYTFLTTI